MLPAKFEYVEIKGVIGDFWSILKPLLLLPLLLQGNITLERALSSLVSLEAVSSLDYAKFVTETVVFFYQFLSLLRAYLLGLVWIPISLKGNSKSCIQF